MALPVTITGISTAVAPVGPFKVAAGNYELLVIDNLGAGAATGNLTGTGADTRRAQTATNPNASSLTFNSVDLALRSVGSPTGFVYVDITTTDYAGSVIATSDPIACSTLTSSEQFIRFTFSSPPTIAGSATFGIVIRRTDADAVNYVGIFASTAAYAGGTAASYNGTTWTPVAADFKFRINKVVTVATDAYYFFGRDATTATTLQAYKAGSVVVYNIVAPTTNFGTVGGSATTARFSQSFTMPATSGSITSVSTFIAKLGSPTDNIQADIYATDGAGKPTGLSLGTTTGISGSTLTTTQTQYTFTFPTQFTASASTQYAIAFSRSGSFDAANNYRIGTALTNVDAAQGFSIYNSTAGTWGAVSASDFNLTVTVTTAPDTGWASAATKTGFTTAILNIAGYQKSNVIHLLVNDGTASTSFATKYLSFDAATDTFLASTETVGAAVAVTGQIAGAGAGASLVVRSDDTVVCFYSGLQTKTSGTFRARVYYRIRTGVNTYGTETSVDGGTAATDASTPFAILGAANRVHFAWTQGATTGYRTLSAANAQNTVATNASMTAPGDGVSYDRSGTTKVVWTSNVNANQGTLRLDSSDNPTATFANQSITAATIPHRIGTFPNTDDVTIVYRSSADSDLYSIKSSDDGATFSAPVSFFVGTVANADANVSRSSSGSVYTRGSNSVVGYLVNDGGTLKYNESIVASLGITGTLTKTEDSDTISAAGNVPLLEITGDLSVTEANDTVSAAAAVAVTGTLSTTEANDTLSAAGTVANPAAIGTLNLTEANDTISATGGPVARGTLGVTETADVISATTIVLVGGTLSRTEAADTISSVATVTIGGTLSVTEANDTISAAANVAFPTITGTLGITEANDTISAAGTVVWPTITGTLSVTEANDTLASVATATVNGTLSVTEANDTVSAAATIRVNGTLGVTEANDTLVSVATVRVSGVLAITEANDTIAATGDPVARGTLDVTEAVDTISAATTISVGATLNVTETADIISAAATVRVSGTLSITEASDTLSATGIVLSGILLSPSLYDDASAFLAPVITVGSAALTPGLYADADNFFVPVVAAAGAKVILPSLYDDAASFKTPTALSTKYLIHPGGISIDEFITPAVVSIKYCGSSGFRDAETFFATSLSQEIGALESILVAGLVIDSDIMHATHTVNRRRVRSQIAVKGLYASSPSLIGSHVDIYRYAPNGDTEINLVAERTPIHLTAAKRAPAELSGSRD